MTSEIDDLDLGCDLHITKISRRASAAGKWVCGMIAGHRFDALVFPEHADNPRMGNRRQPHLEALASTLVRPPAGLQLGPRRRRPGGRQGRRGDRRLPLGRIGRPRLRLIRRITQTAIFKGARTWRTSIVAVNEATGRRITVRSPQRLRPLPPKGCELPGQSV